MPVVGGVEEVVGHPRVVRRNRSSKINNNKVMEVILEAVVMVVGAEDKPKSRPH